MTEQEFLRFVHDVVIGGMIGYSVAFIGSTALAWWLIKRKK